MIDKDTVDRILDAARIEEVIGDFVALKRRGANYIACCPFHNEKTPSFSVSPVKGIYKCFGCGKAGNAVSFVMEHEHLSYVEALRYLAHKYNIDIVEREESAEDAQKRLYNESLLIVNDFAQKFFTKQLWETDEGKAVGLSYFKERGFTDDTIKKFGLGYAPNEKRALTHVAQRAGYKTEHLVGVGLTIERDNGELLDRYYERVIFPIKGLSGKVIAFGGRKLRSDKNIAKYINSPESPIYVKNRVLYGIYEAKNAIAKEQKCYLVEGYTDVISFSQAGIENVVASSGTSLTTGQIQLIKRFTNNVTVLYDGDFAGIKASLRGIDMLLNEGLQIKVALFPDNEDPDSYARSHTPAEVREFLETAEEDFISFKYRVLHSDAGDDPIKRAQIINDIINSIACIPDPVTRNVYAEQTAQRMNIKEEVLQQQIAKIRKKKMENAYMLRKQQERNIEAGTQNTGNYGNDGYDGNNGSFDGYGSSYGNNGQHDNAIQNEIYREEKDETEASVENSENELVYYLLNFGRCKLYINTNGLSQEEVDNAPTVAQYIKDELAADELELRNRLCKQIFDEYYALDAAEFDTDEKVQRFFTTHSNPAICSAVIDIITQPYAITIKQFTKTMVPEKNVLGKVVPKAMLIYKAKVINQMVTILSDELKDCKDNERLMEIISKLNMLNEVRRTFSKELNRITI